MKRKKAQISRHFFLNVFLNAGEVGRSKGTLPGNYGIGLIDSLSPLININ
jgi:hypothetical protein